MLAPATPDRKITTNAAQHQGVETYAMGIHEDAINLVMDQLADLYKDQLEAMLREYATNAIDAHLVAGVKRPIEVTLPSQLDQVLRIRDFGTGLSAEDMRLTYSQYGASTKRDNAEANGFLGFGCKCALAYSDSMIFNVTSVKDGQKVFASIARTPDGPQFTVVSANATDEKNGTTIEIPIADLRDQRKIAERAKKVYGVMEFARPGQVLVNGKSPEPLEYHLKLTDDLYIVEVDYDDDVKDRIVMGNVAYPASINHGFEDGYAVIAKVPNGAVEFVASREALKEHKHSVKSTIEKIESAIQAALQGVVQRDVDAASTPREALVVMRKWRDVLSSDAMPQNLKFKGRDVPTHLSAGPTPKGPDGKPIEGAAPYFTLVRHKSHKRGDHQNVRSVMAELLADDTVWIENFGQANFTPTVKRKMEQWADKRYSATTDPQGWSTGPKPPTHWILTNGKAPDFWVDRSNVIDYSVIKAEKLPVNRSGGGSMSGRPRGSYTAYIAGVDTAIEAQDIVTDKGLFWFHGNTYHTRLYSAAIQTKWPDATIVYMGSNRIDKFCRDFPMARRASEGAAEAFKDWKSKLDPKDLLAKAYKDSGYFRVVKDLDPARIADPAIVSVLNLRTVDTDKIDVEHRKFLGAVSNTNLDLPDVKNPLANYPLAQQALQHSYYGSPEPNMEHIYLYIQAVYTARNAGIKI